MITLIGSPTEDEDRIAVSNITFPTTYYSVVDTGQCFGVEDANYTLQSFSQILSPKKPRSDTQILA